MEITYNANVAHCYGKTYIDHRGVLRVRQFEGDYAVLKNVDFGTGCRGVEIGHYAANPGTALVNIRLDSLDGRCIGVVACAQMAFDNLGYVKAEIEETSGIHDVYLQFTEICGYRSFRFTKNSPYEHTVYTPVPKERLIDVQPDTWEATDMLGRKVPSPEECPGRRDKKVGIFYWTWHENGSGNQDAQSIIDVLKDYPEAEYDGGHHAWGIFNTHWNRPLFGYYRDTDPYVIRKHMIMLSNAGVDFLAFDTTNGTNVMKEAYTTLLEQMRQAKLDGINVPKITFIMSFGDSWRSLFMLRAVYQDLYKPGLYEDLWYKIDGKPVVMAYPGSIPEEGNGEFDTKLLNEMREFFTFRPCQPSYGKGPVRPDQWGWLESAPQHKFGQREDGSFEQMTVGVAQNRTADRMCTRFNIVGSYGRSYTNKNGHELLSEDSYKYGYNFQEQWDNAIEADPDIVFVTGWNEWTAGRWTKDWIFEEGSTQMAFVDQFDREHSRDIEPDCDGYLDTYYLQLCANIRKFKGTAKVAPASAEKTVDLSAGESQWADVSPVYLNHKGSTQYRDYPGFGKTLRFSNRTGRNDIIESRVARDSENLYFFAKCVDNITDNEKENCMMLFLNTDRNPETGWEGYNYRVVGSELQKNAPTYKNCGYGWEKVADIEKVIKGNTLSLKIKKVDLNIKNIDIEFKWADNCFPEGRVQKPDVMDFYTNGVTAPFGRFNYRYKA